MDRVLIALLTMGGLGFVLSAILSIASKKLHVEEDPRIKQITEVLPDANCGACGFPSCHAYAELIAQGKAGTGVCFVGGKDTQAKIAKIMKLEPEDAQESKIACVRCQGGKAECKPKFRYQGVQVCSAVNQVKGGDKACAWGCLGYGDCVSVCPCNAIKMNDDGLPEVSEDECTGCGLCVKACPRSIICLIGRSQKIYLACLSQDKAKAVKDICTIGCFACTLCANPKFTPDGLIIMKSNLPQIQIDKVKDWTDLNQGIAKCPAKCYVVRGDIRK